MIEQPQLDFDATMPDSCPQDAPGEAAGPFGIGEAVHLRGCPFGKPGVVLRLERGRAVIYWRDMDHISRHRPITLMHAEPEGGQV